MTNQKLQEQLCSAASNGDIVTMRRLMTLGTSIFQGNTDGKTALSILSDYDINKALEILEEGIKYLNLTGDKDE